jgi:MoxR-like ATPase
MSFQASKLRDANEIQNSACVRAAAEYLEAKVLGQKEAVRLTLTALLAGGHVLLEGPPGVGKTSMAQGIAHSFGGIFRRVQMTSDLLPSDILGSLRLKPGASDFEFRPGPIFANVLLADELNRASAKTQAALLEAMAEGKVTVDGVTRDLPAPFFAIATQNPQEFQGVYPLSESQLDRFMLQADLNVPDAQMELELYRRHANGSEAEAAKFTPFSPAELQVLRNSVRSVFVEESILNYAQQVAAETRKHTEVAHGASVRAVLQLIDAAKSLAFLESRDFVIPADVAFLAPFVLAHRLCLRGADPGSRQRKEIVRETLDRVAAPK